jgi:low temperature requirement protein LtrA
LLRDRSGGQRVTNIELFFDLVYVFAVTQLSHFLLHDQTVAGALRAGIIVTAAGDEKLLSHPSTTAASSAAMILGGPALFLAGHAAFKFAVWRVIPWTRLTGIVVLGLLALAASVFAEIALAACAAVVVAAVAAIARRPHPAQ